MPRDPRATIHRGPPSSLRPIVAALAAALPLWGMAQSRVPTLSPPPVKTVPIPAASWRVYGSGAAAPVNTPNAQGGIDQKIRQDSTKAIYQWGSFDIGASSSVTFDMKASGSSALNRVLGSTAPSRIFGKLSATNGGEIYLINGNGILFGKTAQVNLGSLVASTLNVSDDEFKSGLVNAITTNDAAFRYEGLAEDFVDERNFVRVDEGADIRTTSGGRVFLFAKRVENAGDITSPGGQVVLGAGGKVYLALPNAAGFDELYASESNPAIPVLRGLVVEVGSAFGANGSAVNEVPGAISTPRGNITIVGMAVNQLGRLSATTSVAENGSIILRAQGQANPAATFDKTAQAAGALQIGPGSVIEILPDDNPGADGKPLTSTDTAGFIGSTIDIAGRTVRMFENSRITAPGADVDIRAEARPRYLDATPYLEGNEASRISIGANVVIDVSGTTDTVIDGSRNFVTTELLGSNDLRDAPLQKDGLLFRSKVTLDTRGSSPILGDLSGYRGAEQRTVGERLSRGGSVSLVAQGGVVMRDSARIDVSGGQISFTEAQVAPTQLMSSDGTLYDLNHAPADLEYTRAYNLQKASNAEYDRWGLKVNYGGVLPARTELAYTQGTDAGRISVIAPTAVLDGSFVAGTIAGERQQRGEADQAVAGTLALGAARNFGDFGSGTYAGAVLRDVLVGASRAPVDPSFWDAPMTTALPAQTLVSIDQLREAGFGQIDITAQGDVQIDAQAGYELPDNGQLRVRSQEGTVALAGTVRSAGSAVELRSQLGAVELAAGSTLDVSGRWINQQLDGPKSTSAIEGGSVTLAGVGRVSVGSGSLIDVSGGAAVSTSGSLSGGDAGRIVIAAQPSSATAAFDEPALALGGRLEGYSLAEGGSLSITAPSVRIGSANGAVAIANPASLTLEPGFFREGGFSSFAVDGKFFTDVAPGTEITASRNVFVAPIRPGIIATGTDLRDAMAIGQPPLELPRTVDVSLASSGVGGTFPGGALTVGAGAVINTPAASSVKLSAGKTLQFDGEIVDHGGDVSLVVSTPNTIQPSTVSYLWLGETSRIDVSGVAQIDPAATDLVRGEVLAGGSVTLSANGVAGGRASSLVWKEGSQIDVRGAQAALDVTQLTATGVSTTRQSVASEGGSLAILGNKDLHLDGSLLAQGGSADVAGGRLSVSLTQSVQESDNNDAFPALRRLTINQPRDAGTSPAQVGDIAASGSLAGTAGISAQLVNESGAADFSARSHDQIVFEGPVDLNLDRELRLDSRALVSGLTGPVRLSAATVVLANSITGDEAKGNGGEVRPLPEPAPGPTGLRVTGQNVVLDGRIATRGFGDLFITSAGDLRLQGANPLTGAFEGALLTSADVHLDAARIYPATGTTYRIDAPGRAVDFLATADNVAGAPVSAGGSLIVDADTIRQGGAVFAPHGRIELHAQGDLTLTEGSITSVSGDGVIAPYGQFTDSNTWFAPDNIQRLPGSGLSAPPSKNVVLDSTQGTVSTAVGSTVDLSAGGEIRAYQFVPGPGGSTDVFTGADGAYAIVPGVQGLAPYDRSLATNAPALGREIVVGAGGPVPAGRYTLLPARYALLPGGYLVKPDAQAAGDSLALGAAIAQPDGSSLVGARLADAGTGFSQALSSTWRITPLVVARKSSEIREADASTFFNDRALRAGEVAPRLPVDAGTLTIATQSASLEGATLFNRPAVVPTGSVPGRGGEVQIAADRIRVSDETGAAIDGVLTLQTAQLNAMGADTLLLGAQRGTAVDNAVPLAVRASEVVVDSAGVALGVPDLVIAATERVEIGAGSVLRASAPTQAQALEAYSIAGDGAALRLSSSPGAALLRTDAQQLVGELVVGAGTVLGAASGTLVLDATARTAIAANSRLNAADITVTAARMVVGPSVVPDPDALAIGPALTRQLGQAESVTLRSYESINFNDGASLSLVEGGTLTLDTPRLLAGRATGQGAQVDAGRIVLANSTGTVSGGLLAGQGQLDLHATASDTGESEAPTGVIELGDGAVAVGGASVHATADTQLALAGNAVLRTSNDLRITTPIVSATGSLADAGVIASGVLTIDGATGTGAASAATPPVAGAALSLSGGSVQIASKVVMPAGVVVLEATGTAASDDVRFASGGQVDTSGRRIVIDDAAIDLGAGRIRATAQGGSVIVGAGSVLNVSAAGGADAGRIELVAEHGVVQLDGSLRGSAASAGGVGAALIIDSATAVDLAQLSRAITSGTTAGFDGEIAVRNRQGDQTVAGGVALQAAAIRLQADAGALQVQGRLDASGAQGGQVELAARDDLVLEAGAQVLASATATGESGGRVSLSSTQGEIALQSGSSIDVSGRAAPGGRVLLRAAREGAGVGLAGDEVRIAAIDGEVTGASRIDVEAVKVYQAQTLVAGYIPIDALQPLDVAQVTSDGEAFLGVDGSRATSIAQRVASGDGDMQSLIRVHAGAEVQSSADISYQGNSDWFLPNESVGSAAASTNAGDTTLTLRAAGNVVLPRGIASGFLDRPFGFGLIRGAEPASDDAGTIRVVAGADLAAASPLSTVRDGLGDVTIGRAEVGQQPVVALATTTGDVQIAAARDIVMRDGRAMAYTYGVGTSDVQAQAAVDAIGAVPAYRNDLPVGVNRGEDVMPFREGGGDVSLSAGRDVIGRLGAPLDPGSFSVEPITLSDWRVMRYTTDAQGLETGAWWAALPASGDSYRTWVNSTTRTREFMHGIATFGGGDVAVTAGRDVTNLGASAASSGYWQRQPGQTQASVQRYGGGDVTVYAQRDVVNGLFFGAGDTLRVAAERDLRRRIDNPTLGQFGAEFHYENTAVSVSARRDIDMNGVRSAFGAGGQWMWGLDGDASLSLTAVGGSVRIAPPAEPNLDGSYLQASSLIPASTQIAAPQGALTMVGAITQQPVDDATLRLLARDTVTIDADIRVNATRGSDRGVGYLDAGTLAVNPDYTSGMGEALDLQARADHGDRLDRSARTPVQVASLDGSVVFSPTRGNLATARPVRVVAGDDVQLNRADAGISAQHQDERFDPATQTWLPVSELSLIQAGGDLSFIGRPRIQVGGTGDLVVLTGGNIDLGTGLGIVAIGNTENGTVLPTGSAAITLVAGLRADGVDYARAVRKGFQALGGLGLTDRAGDLYALLDSSQPTVPLGSSTAKAFDADTLDNRLRQTRDLVGDAAYEQSIAAYVRGLPGNAGLTDAQAVAKFPTLGTSQRDPAPGIVLADAFALREASRRVAFVASVAQAEGQTAYGASLTSYMQRVTGQALALTDAVAAFEALPLARQVPLLNQVLVDDLRRNGRVAASTGGDAAAIAYARGYRAIDSLFPIGSDIARPEASISLASSQIRTLQGGDIALMAPGGSANAGETSSLSLADPSTTGIVTVAGGDISAVVRDDFLVNRSRVFSLAEGDILLWSSSGDIDAGRGAKTVVGAPAPVLRLNADGKLELDTSGSFTGSGIAVLDSGSALDLYAPQGAIDAGEAGIRASGNAFFGAQVVRGADNLQIGGSATGAPVAPPTVGNTAGLTGASQDAANRAAAGATDDEDERRKRRARRTLLLEFLGFGGRG